MEESKELLREEKSNLFSIFIRMMYRGICFFIKFSVYLCLSFIQMIIDIVYKLMDFENWNFLNKREDAKQQRLLEVEVDENSTRHEYIVKRSKEYDERYKEISNLLHSDDDKEIVINSVISNDILAKIDIIVYESEKNALRQGYKFAKETKCMLDDESVYKDYIQSRVMRGE